MTSFTPIQIQPTYNHTASQASARTDVRLKFAGNPTTAGPDIQYSGSNQNCVIESITCFCGGIIAIIGGVIYAVTRLFK